MNSIERRHTLADLVRRSARRSPSKIAVQCGETRWSYAELDAIVDTLAGALSASGLQPGDRMAVLARNSHAFVALRFALARMGAVLVPINFMLKAEEVAFILRHSGACMLATDSGLAALSREAASLDTSVETFVWLPSEGPTEIKDGMLVFDELLKMSAEPPEVAIDGSDLAQIVYTSGTESLPKGAMLTHGAVIAEYVSVAIGAEITAGDLMLHALPLYHCAQLDVFLGPCIYVGATNVITAVPSPENLLNLLAQHKIQSFFAPPTVWIGLLRSSLFDQTDLGALKKGYYGASIMPVEVLRELARRLPEVRLWNLYGQTEIAPLATLLAPEDQLRKAGSAGKPVLNVETRVVDDHMQDVSPGQVGEIVHRSPQLMLGYYRDEERTRAAFEGGWFHSGDLGAFDDEGYLTVVDRKKDMIKTGGENVASREVEEAIYRMEEVSEVAVVGVPHPRWVEGVLAIIVAKENHDIDEKAVIAFCAEHLAGFKSPKRVIFVDSLPKNPSGKLLKRELRNRYLSEFS